MNHGAKRLQELYPHASRGGLKRLAELVGTDWSVAGRWRTGERKPITRFRIRLCDLLGIPIEDWDVLLRIEVVVPVVEVAVVDADAELPSEQPESVIEPESETEERPRVLRSLRTLTSLGHASR
jgi:hypothetical protein